MRFKSMIQRNWYQHFSSKQRRERKLGIIQLITPIFLNHIIVQIRWRVRSFEADLMHYRDIIEVHKSRLNKGYIRKPLKSFGRPCRVDRHGLFRQHFIL
jgi:hypothetical protein